MQSIQYLVVMITTKDKSEAQTIAEALLKEKLVACANIMESVQSHFWWQGKIDQSQETMLILKTKESLFENIVATVKSLHSYDVPEIIAFPIVKGNWEYLQWIKDSVQSI